MTVSRRAALRGVALAAGLAVMGAVVASLGARAVLGALRESAPWLPLVVLLEMGIAGTDVLAARTLLGPRAREVSAGTWLRGAAYAYACSVVLPAGRAAGEAARAATLKSVVGVGTAARTGARVQTAALFGTAAASAASAIAAANVSRPLGAALLLNALICGALAIALSSLARSKRVGAWLARLTRAAAADAHGGLPGGSLAHAAPFCILGRVVQVAQYGIVLHAVGGHATPRLALVTQGVHLVGATAGDFIPNQLGATEGAYRLFTSAVGLEPARAVAIALAIRAVQLSLAAVAWCSVLLGEKER